MNKFQKHLVWCVSILCLFSGSLVCHAQLDESNITWTPDRGITLNGTTEYFEVADAEDFNLDTITVECWVNLRDISGRQQIAGRGEAAEYFTFYNDDGDGRLLVENSAEENHESAIADFFPEGEWFHIAGVYDGSQVRLYYNGVLVDETEWEAVTRHGEDPLRIGALEGGQRHLNGMFENLRIWNRALSEEEIIQLLATEPEDEDIDAMRADGLISYWAQRSLDNDTLADLASDNDAEKYVFTLDQSNLTFIPEGGIPFDGQSTYAEVDGTPFNLHAFSLEVWVKFDRTHENQVFMNRGGAPELFTFYLYDRVRFLVEDVSGYNHANGIVPPANEWIHIVGTRDEEGNKQLYYNGVLQNEHSTPGNPLDSDASLIIGALEPGSRHLDGEMENLRVWNKALSEDEIIELIQTPPEEEDIEAMKQNGLIAYWAARSIEDDQLIDLTGNGNDGTFGAFEIDESHLSFTPDKGIPFDGESNYGVLENPGLFEIDDITIEAWVYLDPIMHDLNLSNRGIVGRGGAGEYFSMYGGSHYGNRLHMAVEEAGDAAAPMPPAEMWVHVCGTFDMDFLKLYYNGVQVDDMDAFGIIPWGEAPLYIGALSEEGGLFEGQLDNIRIWDRALTQEEIQDLLGTPPDEEDIDQMRSDGLLVYYTSQQLEEGTLVDISGNGHDAIFYGPTEPVSVQHWSLY